jgi:hypothetical protein
MEDHPPVSKSIFDTASELSKAHKQKKQDITIQKIDGGDQTMAIKEMVRKGEAFHADLSTKIDTVFTVHQILPSKYRHYLSQQQNFSEKDWRALEEQRKKNEELLKALGKRIGRTVPSQQAKQEKEVAPHSTEAEKKAPPKKGKIITKRHWIGM